MKSDPLPPLHLAPQATPDELSQRYEHERRAVNSGRERGLESEPFEFRIGSVPYLNAVPLVRGLESQIIYGTPSKLAVLLRQRELDAALLSVTEVLFHNQYDILDGIAIASLGEVKSVVLAHRQPIDQAQVIHCDPASLASVNLLRVLLAEHGWQPAFQPLESYETDKLPDYTLLIGDRALDLTYRPHDFEIWDLGAAWYELTRLPFVYAVWALQRGGNNTGLRRLLRETKDFGMETLDYIIDSRTDYDRDFRRDYLTWHIHYHLGADEKRGLARFVQLLRKHTPGPVYDPQFVT